ncbi:hypothetical protein LguiB_012869 [Lonicera macranthoides]
MQLAIYPPDKNSLSPPAKPFGNSLSPIFSWKTNKFASVKQWQLSFLVVAAEFSCSVVIYLFFLLVPM